MRTFLDQRFLVAGGTDSPVIPYNPFWSIYHFITRDTISDGVYGPSERITREEALRVYTINNARLTFEEKLKGSIEPGKLADLVVLSGDYLTVPEKAIESLKPVATMIGGRFVYVDPAAPLQ
jgi:predicted amidohydrolase YtcJ